MNKRKKKSVFLSSTFTDLAGLRKKVSDRLQGLSFSVISMEHFPASGHPPLKNAITELEKGCDYFVLIIGARYGTMPDGQTSITHLEYRKAIEMKSKKLLENIFIFIGRRDMKITVEDRPNDTEVEKVDDFRKEIIADGNTYRSFSTEEELFQALYETFANEQNFKDDDNDILFENLEQIKFLLDDSLESKPVRVTKTLNNISKRFSPIFDLDTDLKSNLKHPIIKGIKKDLEEAIPDVAFDTNLDGKIERWQIRHVIFRVETAIKLMSAIENSELLFTIGEQIGKTASKDLFKNVINNQKTQRLIPASIEAFVKLFDYWDSSGGWGKLDYREESIADETNGKWILVTKNNFLIENLEITAPKDIDHLYSFWRGYIKGALNMALLNLSQVYSELSDDLRSKVFFPPYKKIINVERELDENDPTVDIFYVNFENHDYAWAFQMLFNAKKSAETNTQTDRIISLTELFGILSRLRSESDEKFEIIIKDLNEKEKLAIQYIIEHKNLKVELDIYQCIELVNSIVQKFINL